MVCSPTTRASVCPRHKLWSTACSTGSGRTISPSRRPFYLSTVKAAGKTGRQASEACNAIRHELKLSRASLSLALINLSPINISGRGPKLCCFFLHLVPVLAGHGLIHNPGSRHEKEVTHTVATGQRCYEWHSCFGRAPGASPPPETLHCITSYCESGVGLILEINGQMRAAI